MAFSLTLACVSLVVLWGGGCLATPFPFNMSVEGSADGGEPELIFPTARATRVPVSVSPTPKVTTITRLKEFIFNRVVDFLQENLLLIIVVTSLLVVVVFIVCCASAMSHKRKLEAYYPAKSHPPRAYVDHAKASAASQSAKKLGAEAKNLRTPSKALVGEKEGKDPKPKPKEVPKVEEVEEEEEMQKEQPKQKEAKSSSADAAPSPPLVCTCHLKKASPPAQ